MKKMTKNLGFSLLELMVVIFILAIVVVSMLQLFLHTSELSGITGNKTTAVAEAQSKMEQVRLFSFDNVVGTYNATTFALDQLDGTGSISIGTTNPEITSAGNELLEIKVDVCWREKFGSILGEDTNLDGSWDSIGEDRNGNGVYDPAISLVSMTTRR